MVTPTHFGFSVSTMKRHTQQQHSKTQILKFNADINNIFSYTCASLATVSASQSIMILICISM